MRNIMNQVEQTIDDGGFGIALLDTRGDDLEALGTVRLVVRNVAGSSKAVGDGGLGPGMQSVLKLR